MAPKPDHKVHADERDKAIVLLRDYHDCESVADFLALKGQGVARLCPKCAAGNDATVKTLSIRQRFFECSRCDFQGDVIDLVCGVRNCTVDEAVAILTDFGVKQKQAAKYREKTEAEFASLVAAATSKKNEHARAMIARKAFLTLCQPICDEDIATLRRSGITPEVCAHFQIRNGPENASLVLRRLIAAFGVSTLNASGLIEQSPEMVQGEKQYQFIFSTYDREEIAYILVPYFDAGNVPFIRAIPMLGSEFRPRSTMPNSLCTSAIAPCPFNVDVVQQQNTIFIFRREVEAMAATSSGYAAISTSFTSFPSSVIPKLAGRDVFLCAVAGHDLDAKLAAIDAQFIAARVPPPKRLFRQEWEPITELLSREVDQADTAMISYDFKAARSPAHDKMATIAELEKPDPPKEKEDIVKPWSPLAFVTGLLPSFVKKRGRPAAPPADVKPKSDLPSHPAEQPGHAQDNIVPNNDSDATHAPIHRRPASPLK